MSEPLTTLKVLCQALKLPAVAREAVSLAEAAERQGLSALAYLCQVLELEVNERAARRAARRIKEAGFPHPKTLESFSFQRAPDLPEAQLRRLAEGEYIDRTETIILMGEPGTGKTHLATALGMAAAHQGRAVRFITAGRLVMDLIEAKDARTLGRIVGRYSRIDLLILDELGYLPLSKTDAELLFQVLSERHERRALILTTNLPFSEWTAIFPDPRLCRAVIDRLTHRAHIIETGIQSIRLEEAMRRHPLTLTEEV